MSLARLRRPLAFSVHLLTALGAALALLALFAAAETRWRLMFVWLAVALIVDGIDGPIARRLKVSKVLPRWSGDTLDLVVDFLNYTLVPAFALAVSGLLPPGLAIPAALAIVFSSALYFADREMKTKDSYFRGFPSVWNLIAFYLFLLRPNGWIALGVVALFVLLSFVPVVFVHPFRVRRLRAINVAFCALWAAFAITALLYDLSPPFWITSALVLIGIYFSVAGLARVMN